MNRSAIAFIEGPLLRRRLFAAGTLLGLLSIAAIWMAATATNANAEEPEASTTCVYYVEPITPSAAASGFTSLPTPKGCYPNMSIAQAFVPAATVIIGEDFGHTTYGGNALVWTAEHGCVGFTYASGMPAEWNNRVRSAKGQSNCNRYRHFDGPEYGGAFKDCLPKCESMGAIEALTSSEKWFNN